MLIVWQLLKSTCFVPFYSLECVNQATSIQKSLQNIKWCSGAGSNSQTQSYEARLPLLHYLQDLQWSPQEKRLVLTQVQTETLMVLKNSKISQHSSPRCLEGEGLACPGHPAWLASGWRLSILHAFGCSGYSKTLQFITPGSHDAFSVNSLLCFLEKVLRVLLTAFHEPGHCKSWQPLKTKGPRGTEAFMSSLTGSPLVCVIPLDSSDMQAEGQGRGVCMCVCIFMCVCVCV